jgi:hypothetical protein
VRWYLKRLAMRHRSRLALVCLIAAVFFGIRVRMASAVARAASASPTDALNAAVVAETSDIARAAANARSTSAAMNVDRRLRWLRLCSHRSTCEPWMVEAIIDGAPPADQQRALRVWFAAVSEEAATGATDDELATAAAASIAATVARRGLGLAMLAEMPVATLASASKSPDRARGKTLKVTGRILEIRSRDGVVEGALVTDTKTVVRFVTAMGVKGLRAGSSATYRGVFLRHVIEDATRGAAPSLVVIGAFDTPENR